MDQLRLESHCHHVATSSLAPRQVVVAIIMIIEIINTNAASIGLPQAEATYW